MPTENKCKPTPIWPIWVFGIILFTTLPSYYVGSGVIVGCMIATSMINKKNERYFGGDYKTNPKPTKEAIEKFKQNKYNLSSLQKEIVNILVIAGVILGLFSSGGILAAFFLALILGGLSLFVCVSWNKIKKKTSS